MGRSPVARKDKGKTTKHIHYMNTKQLLLSLLMSIMSVSAFAEDVEINGIRYSLNDETLEAEVARREEYSGDIIIPETVDYDGKTYSVTSIGIEAFYDCDGLTSITIPNSVTSIGERAFSYCYGLESIIVENGNTIYDSRENCNAIIETETNTLIVGCKNTVIPNSITIIGERAFSNCYGLTSITIPNSVTSIGEEAFYYCTGLTSVTIGNSVTSIGDHAFGGCESLTTVTIPNSVTSIGDYAFFACTGLTSVISLIEEPFEISEDVFENWVEDHNEFTTATLYVPAGTKAKYESTPAWNKFKNIVEGIENAVKSVETDAQAEETERYNVGGQRISSPQKGLNIVKMSDGTTRKIMCK